MVNKNSSITYDKGALTVFLFSKLTNTLFCIHKPMAGTKKFGLALPTLPHQSFRKKVFLDFY